MNAVEHGGAPSGWLEFSANVNPLGAPATVRAAVAAAGYTAYADLDAHAATAHLADEFGVGPDRVLITAGATEALRLAITACLRPGDGAVVVGPTYGEYERLIELAGATVRRIDAGPPQFAPPLAAVSAALVERSAPLVVLCDPNNPTGQGLHADVLSAFVREQLATTTVVVDQSFLPFAEGGTARRPLLDERVVLVRSLTKLLAIPGVRVGALVGSPTRIAALRALQDPWTVGAHALAAAATASWAIDPQERARIADWRHALGRGLADRGLDPLTGATPFVLAHVGPDASRVVAALARRRVAVRPCGSFGLPEYARVAVRPPDEQRDLFSALDEALREVRG